MIFWLTFSGVSFTVDKENAGRPRRLTKKPFKYIMKLAAPVMKFVKKKKSQAEKSKDYREKMKSQRPEEYKKMVKERNAAREKRRAASWTEEQHANEKERIRIYNSSYQAEYRKRKKEKKIAATLIEVPENNTRLTRAEMREQELREAAKKKKLEEKRERNKLSQQKRRASMSAQKKTAEKKKARNRYHRKKAKEQQQSEPEPQPLDLTTERTRRIKDREAARRGKEALADLNMSRGEDLVAFVKYVHSIAVDYFLIYT